MSHDGQILDAHTVRFQRLLPGPIELAWDYLTKPDLLATWFADVTLDPRIGGAISIRFTLSQEGDGDDDCNADYAQGEIREFRPPYVIAYSWCPGRQQPDGSVEAAHEGDVRFELVPQGDKVRLTLTHTQVPTAQLAGYAGGWHAYLDSLDARLDGGAVSVRQVYGHVHPSYDAAVAAITRTEARS